MHKEIRRQDITFEDKDQALRDDVRTLGRLVGELLKDQGGEKLFEGSPQSLTARDMNQNHLSRSPWQMAPMRKRFS